MSITVDPINSKLYHASNLGDTKPKINIGGNNLDKFVPNINCSFECSSGAEKYFFNLNRRSVVITTEEEEFADGKIKIEKENKKDIFYISTDGNLKWDIEFNKKPSTNVFEWDILCSPQLQFLYQPKLTQDEIDFGYSRPENVVGSYAVYCDKKNDYRNPDGSYSAKYATGKIFHIYRPLCKDKNGLKEWAILDISSGKLTITIPQTYLDKAVYPMTLDPTLGYSTKGASKYGDTSDTWIASHDSTDASGGTTDLLHAWILNTSGSSQDFKIVIYTDDAGNNRPQSKVGTEITISVPNNASAQSISGAYVQTLSASTKYWLAHVTAGDSPIEVYNDAVDANRLCYQLSSAALPATWPDTGNTNNTTRMSTWTEYTLGAAPTRRPTRVIINMSKTIIPGILLAGAIKNPNLTRRELAQPWRWFKNDFRS
jgi:hypothetical protein